MSNFTLELVDQFTRGAKEGLAAGGGKHRDGSWLLKDTAIEHMVKALSHSSKAFRRYHSLPLHGECGVKWADDLDAVVRALKALYGFPIDCADEGLTTDEEARRVMLRMAMAAGKIEWERGKALQEATR